MLMYIRAWISAWDCDMSLITVRVFTTDMCDCARAHCVYVCVCRGGQVTLQWQWPLVLLQSGSNPLLVLQWQGPHAGEPHQPRGHWWSILHRHAHTRTHTHTHIKSGSSLNFSPCLLYRPQYLDQREIRKWQMRPKAGRDFTLGWGDTWVTYKHCVLSSQRNLSLLSSSPGD
jgi:hypothetical protein